MFALIAAYFVGLFVVGGVIYHTCDNYIRQTTMRNELVALTILWPVTVPALAGMYAVERLTNREGS